MKTLTVAEAKKKLTQCIDRVYGGHESFELIRNGVAQARLVPVIGTGCNTHELADDLAEAELSLEDRRAFGFAVRKARKELRPLKNPWR
jgi:antitoxin (DNA-binding transcriptional repressor) of toxin-antitoxin stability system